MWLSAVLGLALACSVDPTPVAKERLPAPDFSLARLENPQEVVRLADLRGKTVVLDFWATWCVPCIDQVPALNAFYEAHAGDPNLAVFGVSADLEGTEGIQDWVEEQDVRYPILLGGDELAVEMGAPGFPVTFWLDGEGRIQRRHVGVIKAPELEHDLAELRGDAS
ncbi:MAG: TlpA disulfide reductase family protein [Myxococcota bacterium]|nr:TlpA disulfide reductase family protein [Myxococcota bacterium]